MSVPLPAMFGKYQLLSHIAEGGMADVYLGRLTGPGGFEKRLVVKVIRPELAQRREFCELFVAEAKITVALTHANIVPVYELGMAEGQYYLAMELVDGPTLHQLVFDPRPRRGGALPAPLSAYVAEQVLRGLDYAHHKGVIHCDLTTANVMCSREGEVKIVDFGIAAHIHGRKWSAGSHPVAVRPGGGSTGYMSPEQVRGETPDARSDLYAVGVLLSEIATGRRFAEASPQLSSLPPALLRAISAATAARPEDRYPDAAALLGELSRYLREVEAPTQSDLSRLVRMRTPDERRALDKAWERGISGLSALPRIITRLPQWSASEEGPRTRPTTGRMQTIAAAAAEAEPSPLSASLLAAASPAPDRPADPPAPPESSPSPVPPLPAAAASPETDGPLLPLSGGTVTFASRPARVHATWRTYAGAVLLVLLIGVAIRLGERLRPAEVVEAPPSQGQQRTGVLHVELPAGAILLLDGRPIAPGSSVMLPVGRHHIEASAPGHRPMAQDVYVRAGETVRERLVLPWSVGHLHLLSMPPGAQVLLNGEAAGVTPLDLDVPLDRTASLRLNFKGFMPAVRDILPSQWVASSPEARLGTASAPEAEPDTRQPEMRLSLPLSPMSRGTLTVGSTPWAQVFVDGERRGDTPLRRLPLSEGSHALRLYCPAQSCQEAREFRQNISIEPGREVRRIVDFRLQPPDVKD